ncbi:class I SAM-dependent methyltransferase [Candidatus Margulisiibacteriota bacterium]
MQGKIVLDLGCGACGGCWILAQEASRVVGVDIAAEAIDYCAKNWPKDNISYLTADALTLPFSDKYFDTVVSFEVIEHIDAYQKYLTEVNRVLRPDGVFILSTPNRTIVSPNGTLSNLSHVREFNAKEFKDILLSQFSRVTIYGQRPADSVLQAEKLLKQAYEASNKMPNLFKHILSKGVKKKALDIYLYCISKIKKMPMPDQINDEDYIFNKNETKAARYLLAICGK